MGADFLFATANVTQPKEYWQTYLGEMDDRHMDSFIQYSDECFCWADRYDDIEPLSSEFFQLVAERVSDAIDVVYDRDRRDLTHWRIDDSRVYAITGGMSWGDEPTEAMDDVIMFEYLQSWADQREDN